MSEEMAELHLFEATGIELEYMIVEKDSLDVRPIADSLLAGVGGGYELEVERGDIAWSNELALHVIELKTNGPAASRRGLTQAFGRSLRDLQDLLLPEGARLLSGAMHPWMNPHAELKLWPHESNEIYRTFDSIFDCRGHGWANLQSMHINLPFCGDDEFGRLHAAIRLVLPILPALAASSPVMDGQRSGAMDSRLSVYRNNARRVPSVSGVVIPEQVYTHESYERELLGKIYRDMAHLDPQGILRHEWLNARGAIARFDRNAIEIRVLDIQESPVADLAIAEVIIGLVRALVEERWLSTADQMAWHETRLVPIFDACVKDAGDALIEDLTYLEAFAYSGPAPTAQQLWRHIADQVWPKDADPVLEPALQVILNEGCLAQRLCRALGPEPTRQALTETYGAIAGALTEGTMFRP